MINYVGLKSTNTYVHVLDIVSIFRPTIDALVEQQEELCNSAVHLLPVEVEQGNHLEVHLSEQVGQLVDVSDGST